MKKEIQNVEGEYFSTYAFVQQNNLEKVAKKVLGKNWEAEDDVAQIQAIIEYMNIERYSVDCSEYDIREDDIIVTKLEDNKYFLFGREAFDLYEKGKIKSIRKVSHDIFIWKEDISTPEELMVSYQGWEEFCEITEDQYNLITKTKKQLNTD